VKQSRAKNDPGLPAALNWLIPTFGATLLVFTVWCLMLVGAVFQAQSAYDKRAGWLRGLQVVQFELAQLAQAEAVADWGAALQGVEPFLLPIAEEGGSEGEMGAVALTTLRALLTDPAERVAGLDHRGAARMLTAELHEVSRLVSARGRSLNQRLNDYLSSLYSVVAAAFVLAASNWLALLVIRDRQRQLLVAQRALEVRATIDALTGLYNRRTILTRLREEMARAARSQEPLSIVLADLDHFKDVNDTHGHLVGDEVLRRAGRLLRELLRPYDLPGRYGGEEFLILLPGCDAFDAAGIAERVRRAFDREVDYGDCALRTTVTLGLATMVPGDVVRIDRLIKAADDALYRAKNSGRNQLGVAPPPPVAVSG